MCNDALLEEAGEQTAGDFKTIGDPTETALVSAAARLGLIKADLERALPRVGELPFDSDRKRMTTMHRVDSYADTPLPAGWQEVSAGDGSHHLAFTKGAVDSMLEVCSEVWNEDHAEPITDAWRQRIAQEHDDLADEGMRVLGVAFRRHQAGDEVPQLEEKDLVFIGFSGMIDPPHGRHSAADDYRRSPFDSPPHRERPGHRRNSGRGDRS